MTTADDCNDAWRLEVDDVIIVLSLETMLCFGIADAMLKGHRIITGNYMQDEDTTF